MMNATDEFRQAMEQAGLSPPAVILPGEFIRFPGVEKRNGNTSGWAKLFEDGEAGIYGDWSSGLSEIWQAKGATPKTKAEQEATRRRIAELQRVRQEEETRMRADAAEYAQALWEVAPPAPVDHPYLVLKQVQPHGLRTDDENRLIVPVRINNIITSVLFIPPDGKEKRFLTDGYVKGGSFTLGELREDSATILIAEGFATTASLYEATDYPSVCAFNAGNLLPVATALRQQYPTAVIVLAGDNDESDTGKQNVGVEAANKAAQAIGGLVAIPEAINNRKTDWNDTHGARGLDAVREAIQAVLTAQPGSASSITAEVERLAGLPKLEYGKARKLAAKRWKVPVAYVDGVVRDKQKEKDKRDRGPILETITPADNPVDGAELADALASVIRRFVVVDEPSVHAIVLWILWSYAFNIWSIAPYLALISPEKRCGKTSLMTILSKLLDRALLTSNISAAAIFRVIEVAQPSLLIDEIDSFAESDEALRGILNSGHTKAGARAIRVQGDPPTVHIFSTWCPKIFAAIGAIPDTVMDRSVRIAMKRRTRGEPIEQLRWSGPDGVAREVYLKSLATQCKRWVQDRADDLAAANPTVSETLNDRAADNWFVLFCVAETLGPVWRANAERAASLLSGETVGDADSIRIQLLRDIRSVVVGLAGEDGIGSQDLCDRLALIEEAPWSNWRHGKPITANQLTRQLRPFGVLSRNRRTAVGVQKGYEFDSFMDAFDRYLSPTTEEIQVSNRYTATSSAGSGDDSLFQTATEEGCSGTQNGLNPALGWECSGVAEQNSDLLVGEKFCQQTTGSISAVPPTDEQSDQEVIDVD